MKASTFSLVVTLFTTIASIHGAHGTTIKSDISELTSFEKLLLRTTHPEVFARGSRNTPGVTAGWDNYTVVDFLNIDLPTLAIQLSKSQDTIKLPSLYYEFGWYWCWIGCAGFLQKYDFSGPEIRNANLTRLNTKINATNIELDFEIPDLQLIVENFTLDDEDLVTGERKFWRGASIFIRNYTLQLSANLGLVPDIGIQVSNVSMKFGVGDFRLRYENAVLNSLPDPETPDRKIEVETRRTLPPPKLRK
ncbi:Structural maintenance of chromosomes protein 6B [Orchesella cincta]|uniref:Structural maintenance of chromosomes protein 6B n=1 Tax=Orchesella cincta TaxID=48709 RepID=A0A1D2MFC3_ORCCI|nr:Structural maintenance of chromosomes protein 6B [Orchesella cincta]